MWRIVACEVHQYKWKGGGRFEIIKSNFRQKEYLFAFLGMLEEHLKRFSAEIRQFCEKKYLRGALIEFITGLCEVFICFQKIRADYHWCTRVANKEIARRSRIRL